MSIDEIKSLVEKFVGNFEGSEDFSKIKANGEDLVQTLSGFSGGLGNLAKSALGKLGMGNQSDDLVGKAMALLGNFAKTDAAKTDFSKLQDAVKKFIG